LERILGIVGLLLVLAAGPARADLTLAIQPIMSPKQTAIAFKPLADFIASATGQKVKLETFYDFAEYWLLVRGGTKHDLVLDSAFYTDYRIKRMDYAPLAKVEGTVSNSLIALADSGFFDAGELVGRRIACQIPPSPQGLVLARMFPNSIRQPVIVATTDSNVALKKLLDGKADAAMVPTPIVGRAMGQGADLSVLSTTDGFPHITLSASPEVPDSMRALIRNALVGAKDTPTGQALLKQLGFPSFEAATPGLYDGLSKYLEEGWLQ
jgi:ABC-type phosphate/phosphonate transport system substrate-binding protein